MTLCTTPCSNIDTQKGLLHALLNASLDGCDWGKLVGSPTAWSLLNSSVHTLGKGLDGLQIRPEHFGKETILLYLQRM
jgi:hypothetical protein